VHADLLSPIEQDLPSNLPVLVVQTPIEIGRFYGVGEVLVPEGRHDWQNWLEQFDAAPPPPVAAPGAMFYTSGTTGKPKGVRRDAPTPDQAAALTKQVETIYSPSPTARTAVVGPMYHNGPHSWGMVMAHSGADVHLIPRFDAETLLSDIEKYKLTHLFLVPTMFVWLLKLPAEVRQRYDVSSLQFVSHAAAPCSEEVKRKMIEWWGPVIHEFYGSTEMSVVAFCNSEQWLQNPGTVGCSLNEAEIKIVSDAGEELSAGEIGTIYARNFHLSDFDYIGDNKKRQGIAWQGLVTGGDVGYLNDDGFLFLCDRKNDMVISGGVNIYPAEIESCLINLAGVRDCAVFGIPDEEYGESLAAIIQRLPGSSIETNDVEVYAKQHLAKYKVPRHIEFVDELPREDSGKIFKRKLRDEFWKDAGRQI
jgi:long-chain acyl-CoA synthetase